MPDLDLAQPFGRVVNRIEFGPYGAQDHDGLPIMLEMAALITVDIEDFGHELPHSTAEESAWRFDEKLGQEVSCHARRPESAPAQRQDSTGAFRAWARLLSALATQAATLPLQCSRSPARSSTFGPSWAP